MADKPFRFELRQEVSLSESEEQGIVIGRAEYSNSDNSYLIRYVAGDGRQVEVWWTEDAIEAV